VKKERERLMRASLSVRIFLYYLLAFGFLFFLALPAFSVGFASMRNWFVTGQWSGWDIRYTDKCFEVGLVATPLISAILALHDFSGICGWNRKVVATILLLLIVFLVAIAEYMKVLAK